MKFIASIFFSLCSVLVHGQEEGESNLKHQFGIAPIAFESNFQLNGKQHHPKLKSLFYYENRFHPNLSWRAELGFAPNIIKDYGAGFAQLSGKMFLIEAQAGFGIRYLINGKTDWPLQFFTEANAYYNGSNLKGTYYSSSKSADFDESFNVAGTRLGLGFDLYLKENFTLTLGYFARLEFGWGNTDIVFPSDASFVATSLGQSDFGFYPIIGSAVARLGYHF